MTETKDPITDTARMTEELKAITPGTSLTIRAESGLNDERTVTNILQTGLIVWGDPVEPKGAKMVKPETATVHRLQDNPSKAVGNGYDITELYIWDDD